MVFSIGQRVFWTDPANETCGVYVIAEVIDDDSVRIVNEHSEVEAYTSELMYLDEVYMCKECLSFNIEQLMWCKVNDRKNTVSDLSDEEKYYCCDCGEIYHSEPTPYLEHESKTKK